MANSFEKEYETFNQIVAKFNLEMRVENMQQVKMNKDLLQSKMELKDEIKLLNKKEEELDQIIFDKKNEQFATKQSEVLKDEKIKKLENELIKTEKEFAETIEEYKDRVTNITLAKDLACGQLKDM